LECDRSSARSQFTANGDVLYRSRNGRAARGILCAFFLTIFSLASGEVDFDQY